MRQIAFIFLLALMIPLKSQSDALSDPFQLAIMAVENRDYQALEEILDRHPDLINYAETSDCSLFCEFSSLLRLPEEGEVSSEIDQIAINILLDRGGNPASSPHALGSLLVSANNFSGDVSEFPINSGVCTKNRDKIFPLANRMITSGAPLSVFQRNSRNSQFTTGFFYMYQLCYRPYICGAEYETASANIALNVSASISSEERDLLLKLVSDNVLSRDCVSLIITSKGEL